MKKMNRNCWIELIDSIDQRFCDVTRREEKTNVCQQEIQIYRLVLPFAQAKQSLSVRNACSPVGFCVLQ